MARLQRALRHQRRKQGGRGGNLDHRVAKVIRRVVKQQVKKLKKWLKQKQGGGGGGGSGAAEN